MRVSKPQSHLRHPLTGILASGGNVRVLRALCNYGAPLSVTQLADDTGMTPVGVRAVIQALVNVGAVSTLGQGRAQLYALNPANPLSKPLQTLFAEEQARWDSLLEEVRETLSGCAPVLAAWLYGSAARGSDVPNSDIDIAIVVKGDPGETAQTLRDSLHPLEDRQQVSFSVVAMSVADLLAKTSSDAWWSGLLRDAKLLKGQSPEQVVARLRREPVSA